MLEPGQDANVHPTDAAAGDRGPGAGGRGADRGVRLIRWLDFFLSEPLRRSPDAEHTRARVIAGACLLLFLPLAIALPFVDTSAHPSRVCLIIVACVALLLETLVLLRRDTTTLRPAFLLSLCLLVGVVFNGLFLDDWRAGAQAHVMLVPIVTVYLLGARLGLALTGLAALVVGLLEPLYFQGHVSDVSYLYSSHSLAAVCLLAGWGVGWLHASARDDAQKALEEALRTVRQGESRLVSLIESTDDIVCSIDLQGRLLTLNKSMRQFVRSYVGWEPQVGQPLMIGKGELERKWRDRFARAFAEGPIREEDIYPFPEGQEGERVLEIRVHPIRGEGGQPEGLTLFTRDITERKQSEKKLLEMHRTLLEVSRREGMAEIATGVLHNVGNALNSITVSTSLLTERLGRLRLTGLANAVSLLNEGELDRFLTQDSRGSQLRSYLAALAEHLVTEREALLTELKRASDSVEHIRSIVTMQQKHAKQSGMMEELSVPQLIDEALRLHAVSLERLGIQVKRDYASVPPILVDRHKLLQILVNLLSNARHALQDCGREDKQLTLRVQPAGEGRLRIQLEDNGVGIAPGDMVRLFAQGFTTKRDGHGFGLHISALTAADMGGSLTAASEGPNQGAIFTLELPLRGRQDAA